MKSRFVFLIILFQFATVVSGQERILSLGYGKTFVTGDSSTFNITFDLNRIPGQSEKAGGYYFLNEIFSTSGWGIILNLLWMLILEVVLQAPLTISQLDFRLV